MIKKLPRALIRPEKEHVEVELWQPSWECYCCHDSGIVVPNLASLVFDGYDSSRDKPPRCIAPGCRSGSHYDSDALRHTIDYRIDALTCQELDSLERENWRRTIESYFQRIQDRIKEAAKEKSLRTGDRTPAEDQAIADRGRRTQSEDWGLSAQTPAEKKWIAGWEGEG